MAQPPNIEAESDAVLAFIHAQQAAVLENAIAQLSDCAPADLRSVVHAMQGTLGSYRLDDAHEAITSLSATLKTPGVSPADVEEARLSALLKLRQVTTEGAQ